MSMGGGKCLATRVVFDLYTCTVELWNGCDVDCWFDVSAILKFHLCL